MTFELPKLKYSYNALEPYIDALTMEIHHTRHHGAYTAKLNDAIKGTDLEGMTIEEILRNISKYPLAVRNNGGGYYNHNLFWKILSPKGGGMPSGKLLEGIESSFGSFEKFKSEFNSAAANRFGSGWAWLIDTGDKLVVSSTPNQDNPLMDIT
ncbi:MAG: superoxide dismutase, partial [Bacteroidales bacterium]|nr:superoxide dismutase [Bacteroidales bacterium]